MKCVAQKIEECVFASVGIGKVGRMIEICNRTKEKGCCKGWQSMVVIVFALQFVKAAISTVI